MKHMRRLIKKIILWIIFTLCGGVLILNFSPVGTNQTNNLLTSYSYALQGNVHETKITNEDMIELHKQEVQEETIGSLSSLNDISRISIKGFGNSGGKLSIQELQILDSQNTEVKYNVKKINYDNPSNNSDKIISTTGNNFNLSDSDFSESNNNSLIVENDFTSTNNTIEIELNNPTSINNIKISTKSLNTSKGIAEINLLSRSGEKIYRSNEFPDELFVKGKSHYNINIGNGKIKWDYFAKKRTDKSFLFVPDFNKIDSKFPRKDWDIDWWSYDDNESFENYIPVVHGGIQKTHFIAKSKNNNKLITKEFDVLNSENVNKLQAIDFASEINDKGILDSINYLFSSSNIQKSNIQKISLNDLNNLIEAFGNKNNITIKILFAGNEWEANRNSIANLCFIGFLPNLSKIKFGSSFSTTLKQYSYNSNPFYISWLEKMDKLKEFKIFDKTTFASEGNMVITGSPEDSLWINFLNELEVVDMRSNYYAGNKQELIKRLFNSELWKSFYKKRVMLNKGFSLLTSVSNYGNAQSPNKFYGSLVVENGVVTLETKNTQLYKDIPEPKYEKMLKGFTLLRVDDEIIESFFLNGKLYWNFYEKNIDRTKIIAYYKKQKKYITEKYKKDNSIQDESLIFINKNNEINQMMSKSPKIDLSIHQKNITIPKIKVNGKKIDVKIWTGNFIIASDEYYNSKYFFFDQKNGEWNFFTAFDKAISLFSLKELSNYKLTEFDNSYLDEVKYKEYKKASLPEIKRPEINSNGDLINDKFITINGKDYKNFFLYNGKTYWKFDGDIRNEDIKYVSLGVYYTSLSKVPAFALKSVTEVKSIRKMNVPVDSQYGIPSPPTHDQFISGAYEKIKIDGIEYGAILKNGNVIWNYDLNKLEYIVIEKSHIEYFTKLSLINNLNNALSLRKPTFKYDRLFIGEIEKPWESKILRINDGNKVKIVNSILISGRWYWNIDIIEAKKIKYISSNGTYFTEGKFGVDEITNNSLSTIKNTSSIWNGQKPTLIKQKNKLSNKNLNEAKHLYFDNTKMDYIFRKGEYYIPELIFRNIKYLSVVDGIKKYYSSFINIPKEEKSSVSSGIVDKQTWSDFAGIKLSSLFENTNVSSKTVEIVAKNGMIVNINIKIDENGNINTTDNSFLKSVKYIDKNGVLYQGISEKTIGKEISDVSFSLRTLKLMEHFVEVFQKDELKKSRNVSYLVLSLSGALLLISGFLYLKLKKGGRNNG